MSKKSVALLVICVANIGVALATDQWSGVFGWACAGVLVIDKGEEKYAKTI